MIHCCLSLDLFLASKSPPLPNFEDLTSRRIRSSQKWRGSESLLFSGGKTECIKEEGK